MSAEAGSSKSAQISSSSFDAYNADIQGAALSATKLASALPADIGFHRSVDRDFAQDIDSCSERALVLTNRLLKFSTANFTTRSKGKIKLEDQEDVVDSFQSLVIDVLDQLFEHADTSLDEFLGRSNPAAIPVNPVPQSSITISSAKQGRLDPTLMHASYLAKPQLKFPCKVDNANDSVWSRTLKHKYNAQVPLGYALHDAFDESDDHESMSIIPHPYRYEIEHISFPLRMFEHRDAILQKPFENTPFTWVDTKEDLNSSLDKLRNAQEIAVDLEHHSYRSFSGFLCLMQISTREEDFIVDTLALREELEDLNEVFTNPKIVKVFHGAESDIVWLQQDFNIYVVNLFDTFHASKLLDFPRHGLAALLEMYCDFIPDKRYQLADWRIRPLPVDMLKYARSDTHFLLYIYDNLRNALLDRAGGKPDLIRIALDRSQETALRTYEREVYDFASGAGPGGWETLAAKWGRSLSGTARAVFRAVHAWRDAVARAEDESTRYVIPNHYLFKLAERPPADMAALLGLFRPVPPLVRANVTSLLDTIRVAVKESMTKMVKGENCKDKMTEQKILEDVVKTASGSIEPVPAPALSENDAKSPKKALPDLWTKQKSNVATTASSALLGSRTANSKPQAGICSSAQSSLFPTGWIAASGRVYKGESSMRYREVVSRIHGALVVAPSLPKVSLISKTAITREGRREPTYATLQILSTPVSEMVGAIPPPALSVPVPEQVEIPFVPAAQRQAPASETAEASDRIVIIGHSRQRKRKRSKQQANAETDAGKDEEEYGSEAKKPKGKIKPKLDVNADTVPKTLAPELEPEPFDYASAPNLLDGPMMDRSTVLKPSRTKGKSSKGQAIEYGNFPAPPRAFNEVKGANKSHTFR